MSILEAVLIVSELDRNVNVNSLCTWLCYLTFEPDMLVTVSRSINIVIKLFATSDVMLARFSLSI